MKTIVIYHRADFDGIFCREIAKHFLPKDTVFIGWDYGDQVPTPDVVSSEDNLYMLDISIDGLMGHPRLVWIDHHKSAMEKFHHGIPGYRIDGVAACRLAWQWFSIASTALNGDFDFLKAMTYFGVGRYTDGVEPHNNNVRLPTKEEFVERGVAEPLSVRLAGEYDIWDKRDPKAELLQHGLRSRELNEAWWNDLLGVHSNIFVGTLLDAGMAIQYAKTQENKDIIEAYGYDVEFEGLQLLACNHARFNSHLFTAKIRPHHQGLIGFNWTGHHWRVSLYGVPGKPDIDLSKIAVKYGGGGHKQACGFTIKNLPFVSNLPWLTPDGLSKATKNN